MMVGVTNTGEKSKNRITAHSEHGKVGEMEMSYQSPIEVFQTQMQSQIVGEIYKATMRVGVNVDKDELLKALQYDRDQYQKGYTDRDSEIVRCKDCKHRTRRICENIEFWECNHLRYEIAKCGVTDDWFCADGEREE